MTEELALKAANLYSEGLSFGKISEELEVSKSRVGDLLRDALRANTAKTLDEGSTVQLKGEQENDPENADPGFSDYEDFRDLNGALEKTLLIQAAPILRKVALNSKVFMQHEFFQKNLGYTGDIGDLLVEALDYYWKEMGFSIKITHDSVM